MKRICFEASFRADSSGSVSRCQVPVQVYDALKAMLVAATRAEELLDTVKEEMRQILGSVGAHRENVMLTSMAASAWNWAALPRRAPTANEEHAFRVASSHLLPYLKKSLYPVGGSLRRGVSGLAFRH